MRFFHGTDRDSALDLLNGVPLQVDPAMRRKRDGPPGFFLTSVRSDAEFFAIRRSLPVVIEVRVSEAALNQLLGAGAKQGPIPAGSRTPRFTGEEVFIPPELFPLFNQLRRAGEIEMAP